MGKSEEAAQEFATYLSIRPDATDAEEVKGWIEKLAR
jgi:hypothetical protein